MTVENAGRPLVLTETPDAKPEPVVDWARVEPAYRAVVAARELVSVFTKVRVAEFARHHAAGTLTPERVKVLFDADRACVMALAEMDRFHEAMLAGAKVEVVS